MGKLASRVKTTTVASGRTYTCIVDTIAEDDADRKAIQNLIDDRGMSIRAKARILGISAGALKHHIDKACQCYRRAA